MVRVILKRIGLAFLTLFGVTVIVFALLQMMPGGPIDSIVPLDASEELRQVIIDQYGFDQPLYMQYFMWLGNAVRGNFGNSVSDNRLVLSVVSEALHNTLILALGASIFAFLLSILIGVYSSYRPNSIFSWIGTVFGIGGISIPNYCLSLILIGIFSVTLRLLPSTGMYTSGDYTFSSLIQHLILPAIAAGAMTLGIMTRMVRSSVSEMRSRSFVTTLRAKGLSEPAIMRHVLRNSFPTLLTVAGLQFGYLMGGSTMVETIFSWPGIGLIIYQSIFTSDFPVTQAAILIVAAIFVSINLLIDLLRIVADPPEKIKTCGIQRSDYFAVIHWLQSCGGSGGAPFPQGGAQPLCADLSPLPGGPSRADPVRDRGAVRPRRAAAHPVYPL